MNVSFIQRSSARWIVTVDRNQIASIRQHKLGFIGYAHDGAVIGTTLSLEVMQNKLRRLFNHV